MVQEVGDQQGQDISTRRLYLVIALMVVTLVTVMSTGFVLSQRLFYALGLTAILSFAWNWLSVRSLDVSVERYSRKVRVGDNVEERITVRNLSRLPRPVLEVEDLTDLPGYSSGRAINLASRGMRSWTTLTPARKRGVYSMGPVRVTNTDVFGLFRRERLFCGTDSLIVYPRTFDVSEFTIPGAYLSGGSSSRKRTHDLTPHAASVREYAAGDSLGRVHWNSTARLGKLMSKEFDHGLSSDVWLFVDLNRDVHAGELEESTDEYAVSIAASLAKTYLQAQMPLGLVAYGDERYFLSADVGAGQLDRVMEFLAMTKAEGSVRLEDALPREEALWGYQSALVLITSSHRPHWVMALKELTRRRVSVAVVLVEASSFGGVFNTMDVLPELFAAGISPYVISKGDDLKVALSYPYSGPASEVPGKLEEAEARQ